MTAKKRRALILELARKEYHYDGTCEIDDDAKLSEGDDNGTYVQAWVWVTFDGTPLDKEPMEDRVNRKMKKLMTALRDLGKAKR